MLIKSNVRLQAFALGEGQDYLVKNGYLAKMEDALAKQNGSGSNANEESVYVLDVDRSIYDVREEGYSQVHCLRFEYERSMGYRITDIDYYLEGNRHARAHSEELFK